MINFVTEGDKWVLRRYCEEFSKYIPYSNISTVADKDADINLFFPYYFYTEMDCPSVAFFTHRESDTPQKLEMFNYAAQKADYCVAMCDITAYYLPKDKTSVIKVYPTDKSFYKEKIVLGVAGKACPSGRKHFELIEDLKKIEGIEIMFADGSIPYESMSEFYKKIDYLVVTSDNEGGSMPLVEALAMGKPVIAPNVGFSWDYSVIKYSGVVDLINTVKRLVIPKNGWEIAASELQNAMAKARYNYLAKQEVV